MSKGLKERLCWNCDGGVSFEGENCPYCGVYLSSMTPPIEIEEEEITLEKPKVSHFQSPYKMEEEPLSSDSKGFKSTSFTSFQEEELNQKPLFEEKENLESLLNEEEPLWLPLLFLLPGITFFLFGLALSFFSEGNSFTLTWDKEFALPVLSVGIICLLIGWRKTPR